MNGNKSRKLRRLAMLTATDPVPNAVEVKSNYKTLKSAYTQELKTVNNK